MYQDKILYSKLSLYKDVLPIVFLSLAVFYGCFIGNAMATMLITIVVCVFLVFCKNDVLLPAMLYYSSFALMFQAGDFMLYEFLCLIFMCRVFVIHRRMRGFLLLWFAIYFITHIISSNITLGNIIPILYIITLLFACVSYEKSIYDSCLVMFLLGILISSVLGFFKPFSPYLIELLSEDYAEGMSLDFVIRFSGLSYDPNFYTIGVIISIMLLLFSGYKTKWFLIFLAVIYTCLGAMTFSKSYILTLCLVFLLYVVDGRTSVSKKILLFSVLGCLISTSFFDEIIYVFKERLSESSNLDDLTTGRRDLWVLYWDHIDDTLKTLFIGHGLSGLPGYKAAHNTYLQILFNFGLLGFAVDFLYMKKCFKLVTQRWLTIMHIIMLAIIFVLLFNLSAYTFPSLWASLFMIFILIGKRSENYDVKYNS